MPDALRRGEKHRPDAWKEAPRLESYSGKPSKTRELATV